MDAKHVDCWHPISQNDALYLCEDIRQENRGKWYKPLFWRCWGCQVLTQGTPEALSFRGMPGNRGCRLVNERYERQLINIK